MKSKPKPAPRALFSPAKVDALRARFERCKQEIARLDWLSEGSVTENHPGTWRWTRKVKAKSVTVALCVPALFWTAVTPLPRYWPTRFSHARP